MNDYKDEVKLLCFFQIEKDLKVQELLIYQHQTGHPRV